MIRMLFGMKPSCTQKPHHRRLGVRHPFLGDRIDIESTLREASLVGSIFHDEKRTNFFEWEIPDIFSLLDNDDISSIVSPEFNFSNCTFRMHMPEFHAGRHNGHCIRLLETRACNSCPKTGKWTLGVKKSDGEVWKLKDRPIFFTSSNFERLPERKICLENWRELDKDVIRRGTVTFTCSISQHDPTDQKAMSQESAFVATDRLVQDLKDLLSSGEASDATVRVKGQYFQVHRSILAARTPVFSAMFKHDTLERASGIVDIEDCEPDTFGRFLNYVYTGRVDLTTPEGAMRLYEVADKYQVDDLKKACLERIKKGLSVDSFCQVISLALRHSEAELTRMATDFLANHITEILPTVDWMNFLCENPEQANELLLEAHRIARK